MPPGFTFEWERLDDKKSSRIATYREGSIESPDSELEEIRKWHIENLLKLKKILIPEIRRLLKQKEPYVTIRAQNNLDLF